MLLFLLLIACPNCDYTVSDSCSTEKCLSPFDTDGDGMLSRGEFSQLCYKLFVGTGDDNNGDGIYDFDPDAIFNRLMAEGPADAGME